jgi:hypothetical protein
VSEPHGGVRKLFHDVEGRSQGVTPKICPAIMSHVPLHRCFHRKVNLVDMGDRVGMPVMKILSHYPREEN